MRLVVGCYEFVSYITVCALHADEENAFARWRKALVAEKKGGQFRLPKILTVDLKIEKHRHSLLTSFWMTVKCLI